MGKDEAGPSAPKTRDMILKAIGELDEKTGSSVSAIKKYISENWPEKAESSRFPDLFKKAIVALLEEQEVIRPKKQEDLPHGATGSFKINKEKEKEKTKAAKEKAAGKKDAPKKDSGKAAEKPKAKAAVKSKAAEKPKPVKQPVKAKK